MPAARPYGPKSIKTRCAVEKSRPRHARDASLDGIRERERSSMRVTAIPTEGLEGGGGRAWRRSSMEIGFRRIRKFQLLAGRICGGVKNAPLAGGAQAKMAAANSTAAYLMISILHQARFPVGRFGQTRRVSRVPPFEFPRGPPLRSLSRASTRAESFPPSVLSSRSF